MTKNRVSVAKEQRGMVLITALVMMVLLMLFVISAIRLSNINLQIVGNYQWQRSMEMTTDSALEQVISQVSYFVSATGWDICEDGSLAAAGACDAFNPKVGSIAAPRCTRSTVASGYSKKLGEISPEDNTWILDAEALDSVSGARVRIHRGTSIRQLAGNCPE